MSVKLTDKQLEKILPVLRTFPEIRLGLPRQHRRFLEAVLRMTRSGSQWRLLPQRVWQLEHGLQTISKMEQTRRL